MKEYWVVLLLICWPGRTHKIRSVHWGGSKVTHVENELDEVALSTRVVDNHVRIECNSACQCPADTLYS